ncbi:hypothetical protein V3851_08465 [Paenibacillus sp. M1]|uniref:Nucleotidyltransferase family protein n=1 Tax=Paenibacillus haidiansis TaxID=1574488 RepID=A0ABU7VQ17_9BACL
MNHQVLFPIIELLEKNNIKYALGGSGLLYYLNLIGSVNDWDITVECPKDKLVKAINGYDWEEQRSGDYPFASQYRLSIGSHNIDFIGSFAFYAEDEVLKLPVSVYGNWDGINLSSPEIWYIAYFLMGRKEKARLILSYLKENKVKVNELLIRDLLKKDSLNNEIRQEFKLLIQ